MRIWKDLLGKYQSLSEEEKEKKPQYGCERYKSLSGNEKLKLSIEKNIAQYWKIKIFYKQRLTDVFSYKK